MPAIRQSFSRLSPKVLVISTLFIFVAIPLTVVGVFSLRSFSPSASVNKLTGFSPSKLTTSVQPEFSWECNCQQNTYRLELRENDGNFSSGSWVKDVKSDSKLTSTNYGDWTSFNYPPAPTSLKTGIKYYWQVSCLDSICRNSEPISFSLQNKDFESPSVPSGLKVTNLSEVSFTLTWEKSSDNGEVTSYSVIESTSRSGQTTSQVSDNTYTKNSYDGSETYYFSVAAQDSAGNISSYSQEFVYKAPDKDSDHDGFFDSKELYYGTDINNACKGHLAWPPDMNDDGEVNADDLAIISKNIGHPKTFSSVRYDLNQNGLVDQGDLTIEQTFLGKSC